ncbi:MAG TPA: hypothetical protein VGO86_16950 [Candidatus Dormibacteraeota bacterium]
MSAALLRIEVRRSPALWLLVLMPAILALSPIAQHLTPVALWTDRSTDLQSSLQGLGPFVAGLAAWVASRERRRGLEELLGTTARPSWARKLAACGATITWALVVYAATAAVILAVTALQATWGGPVAGPPLVGLAALAACTAAGFAIGDLLPSRFTAPLVAVAVFGLDAAAMTAATQRHNPLGYLSFAYPSIGLSASAWYRVRPDLGEVQATWLFGLAVLSVGVLVVRASRRTGVALAAGGGLLAALSAALIATSTTDAQGVVVPLLHNPASDSAVPYTPVCHQGTVPVCVHPAYSGELEQLDGLVTRLIAPVAGLPGAPTRAEQRPSGAGVDDGVLILPAETLHGAPDPFVATQIALGLVSDASVSSSRGLTPAQQAIALYLLQQSGEPFDDLRLSTHAVVNAEHRFAALPASERRAWLAANYAALQRGQVPLGQMP